MSPIADRSVSVRLTADVKPFIAAMARAEAAAKKLRDGLGDSWEPFEKETQKQRTRAPKQAEEVAGAFSRSFSRSLENAFRALPKATITADSSDAQVQLASIRQAMMDLSDRRIGIDINASSALGELRAIQMELERLTTSADIDIRADASAALTQLHNVQREVDRLGGETARVEVDVDAAGAQSKLATVGSEVSRLDGRNARVRVDADVSGALTGIAMVAAALASLPAVASIGLAVGALGGAFAAAGAGAAGFAAVAVPSLGRINEALKQQETAAGGAGGATKSAAQSAAEAASRALQLEQAERRVADAQKAVKQAQEDLTQARRDAKRALEDYTLSARDAALSEEDAVLSVEEARQRLAEVQADPKATDLERERAELSYRQAVQRLDEQRVRTKRLQEDKAAADKAGVEGSDQVRSAQDKLLKSQQDLVEAQKQLAVTQLQQKAAMEQAGGAAGGAASKMSQLSKAEKALAKDIKAFTDSYEDWQRSLQPDVFPVIRKGMDLLTTGMKISTPLIKASAGAFGEFLDTANQELQSEQWSTFFDKLTDAAPRAIEGLGNATLNVAGGLAGVVQAFLPYTGDLMTWVENITQEFEDWGQNLGESEGFKSFVAYAQENLPKVEEIVRNLGTAVGKIFEAAAEPGQGALDFIVTLSEKLAGMSPEQVDAIAKGVAAIFAAAKLGTTLKLGAFIVLADVLSKMSPGQIQATALAIAAVAVAVKGYQAVSGAVEWYRSLAGSISKAGDAADGAKGKFSGLGGSLKAAGIVGVVAGIAGAADSLTDSLTGLNPDITTLAKGISDFTSGGAPAPELLDQIAGKVDLLDPTQWESFADISSRLASDNRFLKIANNFADSVSDISGGLITMDSGAQRMSNIDQALAAMVASGNGDQAAKMFDYLAKMAGDAGVPVDKLKGLLPGYTQAVAAAAQPTNDAATAIGGAKEKLDGFASSMSTFTSRTDYMQAVRNIEIAYKDAARAVEESSGKLDINAQMTDKQKDAVIRAREQFGGYVEKVAVGAEAQEKLSGRTGDATLAVADQLPKLFELAGKSKDAREQVYELAEKFGISRTQAEKATGGAKEFRDMLAQLKSKQVQIELDTRKAREQFQALLRSFSLASPEIPVGIRAPKTKAWGGISDVSGREYMAAGGIRNLGASAPAMIVRSPYMISGRSGPDVVFGEAGLEAYIPLSSGKRGRGLQILEQAAGIMGMAVVPQQMAVNTAGGSTTGGGGTLPPGSASVTLTGIDTLRSSIDTTALNLTSSLAGATSTLDATLGDAGSLTSALGGVGEVAGHLADEVTGWGEVISAEVPPLTEAVTHLGDAVSAAKAAAKGAGGSKAEEGNPRSTKAKSKGSGSGSKGDERNPRAGSASAKSKETSEQKIGISGVATGSVGIKRSGGTNWSQVSRPVQFVPSGSSGGSSASSGGQGSWSGTSGGGNSGPLLNIENFHATERMTTDEVVARLAMKMGARG